MKLVITKNKASWKQVISSVTNRILWILGDFHEEFALGLFIGTMIISMILYRFQGIPLGVFYCLDVALSPYGQFHIVSVDLFISLISLSYFRLKQFKVNDDQIENGKRVLASLMFPILVFSLHDISWLIETHFVPQYYKNGLVMISASLEEYSYHYSKNLWNIIPSLAMILYLKFFKINKKFLIAFLGMVLFHLFNILFQINIYVLNGAALLVMETIDIIPYLFLIKKETKTV